jgi:hypothetical protein
MATVSMKSNTVTLSTLQFNLNFVVGRLPQGKIDFDVFWGQQGGSSWFVEVVRLNRQLSETVGNILRNVFHGMFG